MFDLEYFQEPLLLPPPRARTCGPAGTDPPPPTTSCASCLRGQGPAAARLHPEHRLAGAGGRAARRARRRGPRQLRRLPRRRRSRDVPPEELRAALEGRGGGWQGLRERRGGLVKPSITFFGEELPRRFFSLRRADLQESASCSS
ncbi:unnamed protein product [Prorocentrum cordatum]|uniref:Uncharacterized protein n=1 Tax=Prorocentrum cordatum TaxID=2364126 RepID=A0ABN9PVJ8_9DINO|nr:unnamed protein product [Polarella glacialis]